MRAQPVRRFVTLGVSAALALATVAPGAAQPISTYSRSGGPSPPQNNNQSQPPPSRGGGQGRGHGMQHGLSGGDVAAIAGGAVVLCLIFCRSPHHDEGPRSDNDNTPDRRDLLENGPHVSATRPFGAYAVYGFVRRGWPIVIDYDAEPGATVYLSVAVVGHKPWVDRLDGGHNRVALRFTGAGADDAEPALFTIESAARGDPDRPSRLDILGFGCGPRAIAGAGAPGFVGLGFGPDSDAAVAIDQLRFGPSATPRVGGDFARFSYRTASLFSRVDMEILRYGSETRAGRLLITADPVARFGEQLLRPGPYGPRMWGGLDDASRRPSRGPHRLQVRGWEVAGDESWVTALSTDEVVGP